jgi:hypothetical protein
MQIYFEGPIYNIRANKNFALPLGTPLTILSFFLGPWVKIIIYRVSQKKRFYSSFNLTRPKMVRFGNFFGLIICKMSPLSAWYQNIFSDTSGLFRILMFLVKVGFSISQDLATFKILEKNLQITLWAISWTDFRFVSCYNIQIGLSFNPAPIWLRPIKTLGYFEVWSNIFKFFLLKKS